MGHRETICVAVTTEETVFPIVSLSHSHVLKKLNILPFCEFIVKYRQLTSECATACMQMLLISEEKFRKGQPPYSAGFNPTLGDRE